MISGFEFGNAKLAGMGRDLADGGAGWWDCDMRHGCGIRMLDVERRDVDIVRNMGVAHDDRLSDVL